MMAEFAGAITEGRAPLTDAWSGLRVLAAAGGRVAQRRAGRRADPRHHPGGRSHGGEQMIKGQRCLVTGGAGTIGSTIVDQLVAAEAAEIIVLDNLVRGRPANLAARAGRRGRSGWSRATSGTASWSPRLMPGIDLVFHQAAIRITQCATEPRLALEVLVDGTYEVVEAAADAGVRKVVAASSASVYGLAEEFPTTEQPASLRQRHPVRGGEDLQRGPAAQLPRHARPGLRGAAVLQRVRAADGHPRAVHRGADPLDGADRGRPAAADPRRRHADDGLRLHRGHRAGQPAGRGGRRRRTRSSTSAAAPRPA